jgi:hypothetical protein
LDKHEADNPGDAQQTNMDKYNNKTRIQQYDIWRRFPQTDSLEKHIYDAVKNRKTINDLTDPRRFEEPIDKKDPEKEIRPETNDNYRRGLAPPAPRDPLAIDLAGNGIETVGITTTPILFDHNADGIRTGTGWIKATDAWLVLDRDGNGTIDSGRELFGVDTVLSGRPGIDAVYATTGFQALAALNSNGDTVFSAADAAFSQGGSQFASVGGFLSNCS